MSEIAWLVLAESDRSELGRVTAPDKPSAREAAADAYPGVRFVVQSVASAQCAEPIPPARVLPLYAGARARAKARAESEPPYTESRALAFVPPAVTTSERGV